MISSTCHVLKLDILCLLCGHLSTVYVSVCVSMATSVIKSTLVAFIAKLSIEFMYDVYLAANVCCGEVFCCAVE